MSLEDLIREPWFYSSPGPLSLTYYGILILVGAYLCLRRVRYRRWPRLIALTDSFFLTSFIVLSCDAMWMGVCALRFLPSYPQDLFLVISVLARDFGWMLFCYLLMGKHFRQKVISFKRNTFYAYLVLLSFLCMNFALAPNPTFTDWTYAIRQGCDISVVLKALAFSYGVGKAVGVLVFWSWWTKS